MRELILVAVLQMVLNSMAAFHSGKLNLPEEPEVTMSFVGDCTIATMKGSNKEGSFNWYAETEGPEYFLKNVAEIFRDDDFTVVNCENVLTDEALPERDKGSDTAYWFRGPKSSAKIFSTAGVELAGIANNHMNDYGEQGVLDTIDALQAEGLNVMDSGKPVYMEKNGITVSFLACGIWYDGAERTLYKALDEMVKNSDIQVIYPHGGAEGVRQPEEWRQRAFRNLIDRGADLVVAHHAHRLQPIEEYNGGVIVYGLGNFCFGGNVYPENRSVIYQCTARKTAEGFKFESSFIPCYVFTGNSNNWQPMPMLPEDENYTKVMEFMYGLRETPV